MSVAIRQSTSALIRFPGQWAKNVTTRFTLVCLLLLSVCTTSFSQASDGSLAASTVQSAVPNMSSLAPVDAQHVSNLSPSSAVLDANTGAVIGATSFLGFHPNANANAQIGKDDNFNINHPQPDLPTIDQLDTIATFDGAFVAQAGSDTDNDFRFTMAGNNPKLGGTTVFPGNILEVSWQLLNADGSVFTTVPFAPFEQRFLESPNFEPLDYRSGAHVEYEDAVDRAQFFNMMKPDWHSLIIPNVVDKITIQVPFFVNVQLQNGTIIQARSYFTGTAADGSTFVLMLSPLFNLFYDNSEVNEINLGNFQLDEYVAIAEHLSV
jgi:hypothetical protein